MPTKTTQAIGVFDSGLGGLTVLKELILRHPNENFIYLGDTARLPYGNKSPATIYQYLRQNIEFLQNLNVKAVVVACNSASSALLTVDHAEFKTPIYNVIEPGALLATKISKSQRIGIIGTRATVAQRAYVRAIEALDKGARVYQQACPLLAPLAEEGWVDDPLTNLVVYRYLQPLLANGIDTLILGCTHYPLLKDAIAKVAGPNIHLVHSAETIADAIDLDMKSGKLPAAQIEQEGQLRILTTDTNKDFASVASRIIAPLPIMEIEHIDL